jgi:ABC-type multidrug transport system permease subunit
MFPMMFAMSKIPALMAARPLYFRETKSQMYSPSAYYFGRMFGDIPMGILEVLVSGSILYWLSGLRSDYIGSHFGLYLLCFFIVRLTGIAFVELFAGLTPEAESASSITATSFTIFQLFAGFLISKNNIPRGWTWYNSCAPFPFALSA